jgi:hypothetical protein
MDFINETQLQAELFRSLLAEDETMLGVVVAKATYRISPASEAILDTETPFSVAKESTQHPLGEMPTDMVPWKRGVDLFVLGHSYAPGLKPTTTATASVRVGTFSQQAMILGDRSFIRMSGGIVISDPKPFVKVPLTLEHAYGGKAKARGSVIQNEYNPVGQGFILDEAEAPGTTLPNIEDPATPIHSWNDRPVPFTFTPVPLASKYRADDMLATDPATEEMSMREVSFNSAHPKLRLPALNAGVDVEITGMTPKDPLRFTLPHLRLDAHVWLNDRHFAFPLRADTLAIFVEERRFFVVHRCHFTYSVISEEARLTRLRAETANEPSRR